MTTMGKALIEYVAVRRALGAQLREPAVTLRRFVEFVERQGGAFITTDLALRWAMAPVDVQRDVGSAPESGATIRNLVARA